MNDKIKELLAKAAKLEASEDHEQLAEVYRELARLYHKAKNKEKNEEYLAKAKEEKEKAPGQAKSDDPLAKLDSIAKMEDSPRKSALLEELIAKNPQNVILNSLFAEANFSLRQFTEAKHYYEVVFKELESSGANPELSAITAFRLATIYEDNDIEQSKTFYEKAISLKPNFAEAYSNLGNLLATHYQDSENAKECYEKAISLMPDYPEALFNLGYILANHYHENEEAEKNFEKVITLMPDNAFAYSNLGATLILDYNKRERAKVTLEKAISLNPDFATAYSNLGIVLTKHFKEHEKAKENFEKAIGLNPDFAEAYFNLGNLLASHYKEYEKSKENYEKAISLKPDYAEAYSYLGELFTTQLQEHDKAKECFEKAISLKPEDPEALINFGYLLTTHFEEHEKAKKCYEKAILLKPDAADAIFDLGYLFTIHFKEYEKAKECFERAISLKPDDAEAFSNLGYLLTTHFQEHEKAKECFEKAISLKPDIWRAHHFLGVTQYFIGQIDEAKYHITKAIELNKESTFSRHALGEIIEKEPFITGLTIQKLRHLRDLEIDLDENEPKHLMLTGINGSGKTTVLRECKEYLKRVLEMPIDELFTEKARQELLFPKDYALIVKLNGKSPLDLRYAYESGRLIVKYLGANTGLEGNRALNARGVETVEKVALPWINRIEENLADKIVSYLVDQDYNRLRAFRNKDEATYKAIDAWFERFLEILQSFDEGIEGLEYAEADKRHSFILKVKNPLNPNELTPVEFHELPDGFKAMFKIVFEVMLQMQSKVELSYFLPGIVMIDEPELFLHVRLQERVLPTLTKLFPNIQFIVATHSPFVLRSIPNAVIYDLGKKIRLENLSEVPVSYLNDYYFRQSPEDVANILSKLKEFERLIEGYREGKLTQEERERLAELEVFLDENAPYVSDKDYTRFKENQKFLYE